VAFCASLRTGNFFHFRYQQKLVAILLQELYIAVSTIGLCMDKYLFVCDDRLKG